MAVSITCEYVKSIGPGPEYVVDVRCIDATDIELDIFVFATDSQRFVSVATPYDMMTWPSSRAQAQSQGKKHFRARGVLRPNPTPDLAENFEAVTKSRVSMLQAQWQQVSTTYPSTEIVTVP